MLREFRGRDIPELLPLMTRHFPEEEALIGWRPESFNRVVRGFYRPHYRLLFGLLRLLGTPLYRFFVIEVDGHLAATALLTFSQRAGYVGNVVVDAPYRRRGFAKRLLARTAEESRRLGRSFVVLDVLEQNTPARSLYEGLGYRPLRRQAYFIQEGTSAPAPTSSTAPLRPFRKSDATPLVSILERSTPPTVTEVLPVDASAFSVSRAVTAGLRSTTEAWVIADGGRPRGFIRATASGVTVAGHLTAPVLDADLDVPTQDLLVGHAVAWLHERGHGRILAEVTEEDVVARAALERAGFHEAQRIETLVLRL